MTKRERKYHLRIAARSGFNGLIPIFAKSMKRKPDLFYKSTLDAIPFEKIIEDMKRVSKQEDKYSLFHFLNNKTHE